jgi:hypothetical protein
VFQKISLKLCSKDKFEIVFKRRVVKSENKELGKKIVLVTLSCSKLRPRSADPRLEEPLRVGACFQMSLCKSRAVSLKTKQTKQMNTTDCLIVFCFFTWQAEQRIAKSSRCSYFFVRQINRRIVRFLLDYVFFKLQQLKQQTLQNKTNTTLLFFKLCAFPFQSQRSQKLFRKARQCREYMSGKTARPDFQVQGLRPASGAAWRSCRQDNTAHSVAEEKQNAKLEKTRIKKKKKY